MKTEPSKQTPRALGYRMPAEWEPHAAVWLSWPHDPVTFPDRIPRVEETFVRIIKVLHQSEQVHLCILDQAMRDRALPLLEVEGVDLNRVHLHLFDYADVWFRDYGPIFLVNSETKGLAMVDWYFNAWGQKYESHLKDTRIPSLIHKKMDIPYFMPEMVLEGGSIDVNGKGTLMTTEQCLLHPTRNPHLTQKEIEQTLCDYLGVKQIIWLNQGIEGDDTDGHIDDVARFVNATTVVCAYEENRSDSNHPVLKENYERLLDSTDQDGNRLEVIRLPMPGMEEDVEGRLPASYANFYIGNQTVLVPVFGHENDSIALEILKTVFPDREVVGIPSLDLVYGLGTLHCITQQQPAIV